MKITIAHDIFTEKISLAARFISTKLSSASILQSILIEGKENKIHVYSTDLSTYFHTTIPYKEGTTFRIIVEPKKIIEFLHFLKPEPFTLEIQEKQIVIAQQKTKGSFPIVLSEEYPTPPQLTEKEHAIDSTFLTKELPLVMFAASSDDTRPALTGVNFTHSDDDLLLVSTDGFRLSLIKEKKLSDIPSMIVPVEYLTEVIRNAKDKKQTLFSYSPTEKLVRFRIGEDEFFSRLIDGEFPPFERVIQTEVSTKVTVDTDELMRNIKLISVFARDFSHIVVCEFKKEGLYLRPKKEGSEGNSAFQEVEIEGPEHAVAFNYKFILDLLNHINTKSIVIEILRPDAPVTFRLPNNKSFMHIIMPVRLQE